LFNFVKNKVMNKNTILGLIAAVLVIGSIIYATNSKDCCEKKMDCCKPKKECCEKK
jgi:hypothetical protein